MSDVIGLHGAIITPGEVNAEALASVEKLAEMIRSGEVVGFAAVAFHQDECTSATISGYMRECAVIGRLACVQAVMIEAVNE